MKGKVLIITSSYDKTCDYMINKFGEEHFFRLNLDFFSKYEVSFTDEGFRLVYEQDEIDSGLCKSIYFRKPSLEDLSDVFEERYHHYVHREVYALIEGITESFHGTVLTKPSIMRKANNKIFQASLAKKVGFRIPNYSITNVVQTLETFSANSGIVKPIATGEIRHGDKKEFVQTNLLKPKVRVQNFSFSPVYLQKFIDKDFEVRATFVGKYVFVVKILSENNVDWRKPGNKVMYEVTKLPENILRKCFRFMDECQMEFGCFDFIVKKGEWYFLEMNANGQWLWLELETGEKISDSIADFLFHQNS